MSKLTPLFLRGDNKKRSGTKNTLHEHTLSLNLTSDQRACHYSERLTSSCVHRDRQEREEAERDGRPIPEDEPDDENMPSPFQPINSVITEVHELAFHMKLKYF